MTDQLVHEALSADQPGELYHFERANSEGLWSNCRIVHAFTVNGVVYDTEEAGNYIRPMFSFGHTAGSHASMWHSRPPSEEELDQYVKTGHLDLPCDV